MRIWKLILPAFLLLLCLNISAQEDDLFVYGVIKHTETLKKLDGVKVEIYQSGSLFDNLTTSASAKYEFTVPLGYNYEIKFSKDDMISKKVEFDTRNIPEEDRRGGFKSNMDMTLFDHVEGFDTSILDRPIGKAGFDEIENAITFDFDYTARVQQMIDDEFDRLDNLEEYLAKLRKEFEEEIEKGDQKMKGEKYEDALSRYEKAQSIAIELTEDDVTYAELKIAEAQEKIDEMNAGKELQAKYDGLINEGIANMKKEEYDNATDNFKDALEIFPDEKLPKDKIKEIEEILASLADKEKYDDLIKDADKLFEKEDYALSIDTYKEASDLFPKEEYPLDQISEAQRRLDELLADAANRKKLQEQYDNLITLADRNFKDKNYEDARKSYSEASTIFSDERYPKDKIEDIDKILADLAADAEVDAARDAADAEAERIEKEYQALIDSANVKFDKTELVDAKSDYEAALELKPKEKYPKSRIKRIDEMLEDLAEKADEEEDNRLAEEMKAAEEAAEAEKLERERLAEEDREKRIAEEQAEKERLAAERARTEEEERERRAKLLAGIDSSKEDEVERYYRDARDSEESSKAKKMEEKKEDYKDWLAMKADDSESARQDNLKEANNKTDKLELIHRDGNMNRESKVTQKEREKENVLNDERDFSSRGTSTRMDNLEDAGEKGDTYQRLTQNDRHRDAYIREVDRKKEDVRDSAVSARKQGDALRADNEYDVEKYKKDRAGMANTGEDIRQERIEQNGRQLDEYARYHDDITAAAGERLESSAYDKGKEKDEYLDIGKGKEKLTEANFIESEKVKRENQSFLSESERRSTNERYDRRKELFEKDSGKPKSVDDYNLPEGAEDLPEGVTENSYQINEGAMTVIERTVKIGNKVENYRKVISKTGTYYFKNNRSITETLWKNETQNIGD